MDTESMELISDEKAKQIAMRVSVVTIICNLLLSIFKLAAGILGHSGAMISDAVHSASDVFSTVVAILGINISKKKSDQNHQYGHDRLECVAAIVLAVILFLTGVGIGIGGLEKIISGLSEKIAVPGAIALAAAILSILTKEWMYWYTRKAAKKINSGALMADAWHHRSDALSSIGAFVGILGARMGYPILDPLASVVICLFIGKAAYDIFRDAIDKMVDKSCDPETLDKMRSIILEQPGVQNIDLLQTRLFGPKMYVDIEISADGSLTLKEGHEIAQSVHDAIEKEFPLVKHCMVHVNPV
ncbi:MAG: cation diffusion facilitator family transporter [Blautia sp.]